MKKVDIERLLFFYLCGKETEKKMLQIEKMTYEEFDRICYILIELQFYQLLMETWDKFYEEFREEIDRSDVEDLWGNIEEEVHRCEKWLFEFSDAAPTEELKNILRKIFEIS